MKKVLFIDRDGTLALEPTDFQLDAMDKLEFYPGVFQYLGRIAKEMDFELVMVTNQDRLGTASFPEETFWPTHDFLLTSLKNEGVVFDQVFIDKSMPERTCAFITPIFWMQTPGGGVTLPQPVKCGYTAAKTRSPNPNISRNCTSGVSNGLKWKPCRYRFHQANLRHQRGSR